jgi:hypothetical protein
VYVPFWLFDGTADCSAMYHCDRDHIYDEGDYTVTRTDHFHVTRGGNIAFEKIPVDASKKMPDDYMDSIEPFDYSKMVPFELPYLTGYLADMYDVPSENGEERIRQRVENSIQDKLQASLLGYATVIPTNRQIQIQHSKAKYVLLPVWMLDKWLATH